MLPSIGAGQPVLDAQSLNESGDNLSSGNLNLLDAAGQAAIGQAQAGQDDLGLGYLYTLFLATATPLPQISILCPGEPGICSVIKGTVTVVGLVQSAQLLDWRLDFAAGQNATSGFALISSGTVNVSTGTLGIWNASSLSGFQTLRLVARDQSGGTAVAFSSVFVGDPALYLNVTGFNMPEDVAVGPSQAIYVADRNNDRIAVFSSTGAFITFIGGSGAAVQFNKPAAVTVDGAGNMYVADTNNSRAAKLSPSGQLLLQISSLGEPVGIALDAAGNIYVSDDKLRQVRKFAPNGSAMMAFNLPQLVPSAQSQNVGKPVGLALDAAQNLYVADRQGDRAIVFSSTGGVVKVLGFRGSGPGQFVGPSGIAVSPSGDCLLVSDTDNDRVQKFDRFGNVNLIFNQAQNDTSSLFSKPAGLALDSSGSLYLADRGHNRILKLNVPGGSMTALSSVLRAPELPVGIQGQATAPAEFVFRDLYVFPNPARRNETPTIRVQTGLADSVDIAVYDVSGQRVHSASVAGSRILDDGNGKGSQYTYDYAWDTGHVGPGVYIFMVAAHKAGQRDIRKASKVALIK